MHGVGFLQIAVIEDNESVAKGIAYVLRDAGHGVDVLHDGAEAAEFLRGDTADLIVLDVNLPGMSGLDVLVEMRRRGDARPVLLLTARSDTEDRGVERKVARFSRSRLKAILCNESSIFWVS